MRAVYPQVTSGPAEPALDVVVVEPHRAVQGDRRLVVHPRVHDRATHPAVAEASEAFSQDPRRVPLPVDVRVRGDRLEVAHAADRIGPGDRARRGTIRTGPG